MRSVVRSIGVVIVVAATASCGDVVRSDDASVMLKVNALAGGTAGSAFLLSDVIRNVTTPAPCSVASPCPTVFNDPGTATLAVIMKNVSLAPSTNNSVTVTRYRVVFRRADGRNTPGVDVPHSFDGAVTATIAAGSIGSTGFELVRHVAKGESPLLQLITSPNVISTIAEVTFYGADQVGNDVSATGSILVDFGNFGDSQ
jgi:hypothetical protein